MMAQIDPPDAPPPPAEPFDATPRPGITGNPGMAPVRARGGVISGRIRLVLVVSVGLAVIAMIAAYLLS